MTNNECVREMTFEEELPYYEQRLKEVFDTYGNPQGGEDPLYICVLRDSARIVNKAKQTINCQKAELKKYAEDEKRKKELFDFVVSSKNLAEAACNTVKAQLEYERALLKEAVAERDLLSIKLKIANEEIERLKEPTSLHINSEVTEDMLKTLKNQKVINFSNDEAEAVYVCNEHIRAEAVKEFVDLLIDVAECKDNGDGTERLFVSIEKVREVSKEMTGEG